MKLPEFSPQLSLKEWLIVHLAYRNVFNAPVTLDDLREWIHSSIDETAITKALTELVREGLVETYNNKIFCVPGRSHLFNLQKIKSRLSENILTKYKSYLNALRFLPFIQYVGVSGSVAAKNATVDLEGPNKGRVDLDVFIITSPNCLWLASYFERVVNFIALSLQKGRHRFCFNYFMDRSFLALHNKNFFTATEIFNLRTIFEKEQSYAAFLTENQWASRYYPSIQPNKVAKSKMGVIGLLLFPINILIYLIYTLSRVLKKRSLSPLLDIRLKFDKDHYINLLRRGSEGGGHESAILTQFEYTLKNKFPTYYRASIIRFLFPSQTQITQEQALLKREEFKKYIIYQQ